MSMSSPTAHHHPASVSSSSPHRPSTSSTSERTTRPPPSSTTARTQTAAHETLDILHAISQILHTGLDRETLALCVSLCESGVNPEALAAVVRELRAEAGSGGGGEGLAGR
ncbi:mitotic-spindle organizing gamma-tubulin ring associated-domain-containing protein [Fimicolochytrium jonesii]|uniref:mitotic-spindle organizing gamma-tubulin ring associated-domain-containing protein n=1 Tax=Fimicolochytrium jonesii TaxID=1396493 RepID=UPI0022FEDE58|nr:mitotic-spindle organizing gamma-tubulin ring associated-domain-containing protein [Fimicolochytrium jonesii]KAI8824386.1 mitotic-spindle organizing gamma-tubulin ring associated-domain-containing protein [Fimicolochytrium jonesii]